MNLKDRNATRTWPPKNLLKGLTDPPDDEFTEEITSFSKEFQLPEGSSDTPFETPIEEVMEVLTPKKPVEPKKKRLRVPAILNAPTPEQLKTKINTYLEKLESDPRLGDLVFENLQYSSNDQGYSCMIVCSMMD